MEDTKKDLYKAITTLNKVSDRIHVTNIDREFEARLEGAGQGTLYEIRALAYKYSVPMRFRGRVWKILLGYMPLERAEQDAVLQAKREAYFSLVQNLEDAMSGNGKGLTPAQTVVLKDIEADLPRTFLNGFEGACMQRSVQEFIKRPLLLWGINNEMGYYQGMMDLIYTLFYAFVAEHESINGDVRALRELRVEALDGAFLRNVEADLYHCFGCLIKFYEDSLGSNIMAGVYRYLDELNGIIKRTSHMIDFIQKMPVKEWGDGEYMTLMKKAESALDRDLHRPHVVNRIFMSIQQDSFKNLYQFLKSSVKRLNLSNPLRDRDMPQEKVVALAIGLIFVLFFLYYIFFSGY